MRHIRTGNELKTWCYEEMMNPTVLSQELRISYVTARAWLAKGDAQLSVNACRKIRDYRLAQLSKYEQTRLVREAEQAAESKARREREARQEKENSERWLAQQMARQARERAEEQARLNAPVDPVVASLMKDWGVED